MTLKSYYEDLLKQDPASDFRSKIINECRISRETFYRWIRKPDSIPHLSKELIANKINVSVDELFSDPHKQS